MVFSHLRHAAIHREKSFRNLVNPNHNLDCNYNFPVDLAPIEIPIDAKSIGNR